MGALGALALTGCDDDIAAAKGLHGPLEDEDLEGLQQALTGAGVLKVADTPANLRTVTGGTTLWIAVLQGKSSAGDGWGGVYYWSTTAAPDDGWSVLNAGSGNVAGWRRVTVNGVTAGALTTSLSSRSGLRPDEIVTTIGFAAAGDCGGGTFRFASGVSAGADGYTKINGPNGQYQMLWPGNDIDARCFGLKADDSGAKTANVAAIAAAFAALPALGGRVRLPTGSIFIDAVIPVPAGMTLSGESGTPSGPPSTFIIYSGNSGRDSITVLSPKAYSVIESLGVRSNLGQIHSLIGFDGVGLSHITVRDVVLDCFGYRDAAEADYGVSVNTLMDAPGNMDYFRFERVSILNPRVGMCKMGGRGAQPYGNVWDDCLFYQGRGNLVLGYPGHTPYGKGFVSENNQCCITLNRPAIGSVGVFISGPALEATFNINHCDSEYVKRLYKGAGAWNGGTKPLTIEGGRFEMAAYPGVAAYDETGVELVAAADENFIVADTASPVVCRGACFSNSGSTSNFRISMVFGGPVILDGCTFPNMTPVSRSSSALGTETVGGTYIRGCRGFPIASAVQKIADRWGCENAEMTATVSGAATSQALTFALSEATSDYTAIVAYVSETGTPAGGSRVGWATSRSTTGLTVNVGTPPGIGNTVTFAVKLEMAK
jgi:hypothetical protein